MKRFIPFVIILFSVVAAFAQNISVADFKLRESDMTAASLEGRRKDQNGEWAALIRIETTETGFVFEAGALGIVDTKQETGEVWVWVPRASRKITIKHPKLGVLYDYRYPIEIEAERTYWMKLITGKVITTVEEEVRQQYLIFQVDPKDAALEVNDQLWTVSAEGTARKFVNFGTYTYRVQAPNYHPDAGQVTVDDPKNKKVVTVSLKPNFGWVEVKGANVQGASVYIDNALIGKAPCKSDALKSGEHTVKIAREMYAPYTERVSVRDNETTTISPSLTADFAHVTLKVDADAEIWVNEEKKGVRTWTGDLATGTYRMECRLASHEPTAITKEITNAMEGATITLPAPTPIYGSLNVESSPDFAKIFLDGKPMGETPNFIAKLLIGQHDLKLTKEGYADYTEKVNIAKGENKQVNVKMEKKQEQNKEPDRSVANSSSGSSSMEGTIAGIFSVSANKKVYFSKGNLQYQASTNTWRFAEHQWDVIGEANKNISSTYSGWIDLFGWGTSGYNNKYPYMTSTISTDYGNGNNDIAGTNYDWGVNNKISNGGNQAGQWRTLTKDEWVYVFNTRSTSSGIRYAKACVNSVNGVILLPDDWSTSTYSLSNTNSSGANYTANTITATQWATLEQHGAVFLAAAGDRGGTSVIYVGSYGYYWSASYNDSSYAYSVYFKDSRLFPQNFSSRSYGLSVRLVRSAQ